LELAGELVLSADAQSSGEGGDRLLFVGKRVGLGEVAFAGPPGHLRLL